MRKIVGVLGVVGVVAVPCSTLAFQLEPKPMACMLFFKSSVIFSGRVLSSETINGTDGFYEGWTYTLEVIKPYLGNPGARITVFTPADSSSMQLEIGKEYLLFASPDDKKRLTIGWDGVSGELTKSQQAIADVEHVLSTMNHNGGGDVYGKVIYYPHGQEGLSGIHLQIDGPERKYQVVSDGTGWFHVHVPAGHYSANAHVDGWTVKPYGLTWDDPKGFDVPNGGCAEIQFQADKTPSKSGH